MNDSGMTLTSWGVCIALLIFVFLMMKFFILILRLPAWFSTKWPDRWIDCRDGFTAIFREPIDEVAEVLTKEKKWGSVCSRFNKDLNCAELFSQESNTVLVRVRAYESILVWWRYEVWVKCNLSTEDQSMIYRHLAYKHRLREGTRVHVLMEALS